MIKTPRIFHDFSHQKLNYVTLFLLQINRINFSLTTIAALALFEIMYVSLNISYKDLSYATQRGIAAAMWRYFEII